MLERLDLRGVTDLDGRLPRPDRGGEEPTAAVAAILADVRARGDDALRELTERFDAVALDALRVPAADGQAALDRLDPTVATALVAAAEGIEDFHRNQRVPDTSYEREGIVIETLHRPVDGPGATSPGGGPGTRARCS
jgi:histidinol dehydrogenase